MFELLVADGANNHLLRQWELDMENGVYSALDSLGWILLRVDVILECYPDRVTAKDDAVVSMLKSAVVDVWGGRNVTGFQTPLDFVV